MIYIHGFNSSPQSNKAKLLKNFADTVQVGNNLYIPQIPYDPVSAISQLEKLINNRFDEDE